MSNKCKMLYDKEFYENNIRGSLQSAQITIPFVLEKLSSANIHSCVDFGCGVGTWLFVVKSYVKDADVLGMDFGEPAKEQLKISSEEYRKMDLSDEIILDKMYDLCISLEVAEHIDQKRADVFVDNLTKSSDIILFSAAVPGQRGTGHVNEQRLSYWVEKFAQRGFELHDVIRPYIWCNEAVQPWYRQNIVLFCKEGKDIIEPVKVENFPVDIVHPVIFEGKRDPIPAIFETEIIQDTLKRLLEETYEKLKDKNIVIYGAGRMCSVLINELSKYGIKVNGIAVTYREGNPSEYQGLPVSTIENYSYNDVILIAVMNQRTSFSIKNSLLSKGYNKIVEFDFIPGNLLNDEDIYIFPNDKDIHKI